MGHLSWNGSNLRQGIISTFQPKGWAMCAIIYIKGEDYD